MSVLSWLSHLGEKSSRTDIWVLLITIQYITCLFNLVTCEQNWYMDILTIGMFADLGIDVISKRFGNGINSK